MTERGWTQKELAEMADVSQHTVFRAVSKGVIPRGGNLEKIAGAFGCSVADLYRDPSKATEDTSFAVPKVAELIAAIVRALPTLDQDELRMILTRIETLPSRKSRSDSDVG